MKVNDLLISNITHVFRVIKKIMFIHINSRINGLNNYIYISKSSILTGCKLNINGSNNKIIIDAGCSLRRVSISIFGNNNTIEISENVFFYRGGNLWVEDDLCSISIGANSTFEDAHIAVTEPGSNVIVGRDCMFAYDIDIRTGDSHSIIDLETGRRTNYAHDINIGDHVWIAAHASILKGVTILQNSVVATGSIVTKSFGQEGVLIGGNPAKVLKGNLTWNRVRTYE